MKWFRVFAPAALAAAVVVGPVRSASASEFVRIDFSLGLTQADRFFNYVYLELFDDTPVTQANFLGYTNDGDYDGVVMHRLIQGFVLQGGGFTWNQTGQYFEHIPTDPPIVNEFGRSNVRGTVAMAKVGPENPGGGPDSATSEFFFNLGDNSANLDNQNGGFTVFARVLGDGMDLIDALSSLQTYNVAQLTDVPLLNGSQFLVMTGVTQVQLKVGDTNLDGDVNQDDADLLADVLIGGSDEPQYDVDGNSLIEQADLDLLNDLLMGDIDGDGFVGIGDLNAVLGNWNQSIPPGDGDADVTGDNFVGIADLNAVLGAWNVGTPPPPSQGAAVPEPAVAGLLVPGLCMVIRRR